MFGTRFAARNGVDQQLSQGRGEDGRSPTRLPVISGTFSRRVLHTLIRRAEAIDVESLGCQVKSIRSAAPRVRSAVTSDLEQLCGFLHREWPRVGADAWRRLFDYAWLDKKPNLGFVLVVGDEIVGFLGTVYACRRINGKAGLVCNLTSWCVLPEYRRWSVALLMSALRDRSISYTNLSSAAELVRIFEQAGFRRLEVRRIVMPPLLHAETLCARGGRIISDPERIRGLLDEDQRRIFDDHAPYGCLQLALVDGAEKAYLIAKKRAVRGLPVSELFHCSAPDLLARHLERAKLAILRRQRTLALVADANLFRATQPRGVTSKRVVLVRSPVFSVDEIGNLYSELMLLPI